MASDPFRVGDRPLGPLGPVAPQGRAAPAPAAGAPSFADILARAQADQSSELKFSAHAQTRIASREIPVGPEDLQRIGGAIDRAATKGSRSSLILLDDAAFVVSVPNRTVITVVDKAGLKENVFTNIDSAVIA